MHWFLDEAGDAINLAAATDVRFITRNGKYEARIFFAVEIDGEQGWTRICDPARIEALRERMQALAAIATGDVTVFGAAEEE